MKKLRPTRFYSDKQEKSVAKTVRGKQVSNSGATAMRGKIVSEQTRHKIAEARKGTHHSEETKAKYREQRKGSKNANSKLTKEQVFEIYEKMNSGVNYKEVCKEYGIGQCWAYKIKRKEHWAFNDEQ